MAQYTPEYQPTGDEVAVITTSKGTVRVQLAGKDAPIHVGNFVELARKGFYDGLKFHRHVPGFVIQGGCPNTRDLTPEEVVKKAGNPFAGLGTGGPGYSIKGEFNQNRFKNDLKHSAGVLSMARTMMPNSAGSQFFIMHKDAPHLDGAYAAFGKVTEGMDVVDKIAETDTDYRDKPIVPQVMKKVTVETFGVDYPEPEKM